MSKTDSIRSKMMQFPLRTSIHLIAIRIFCWRVFVWFKEKKTGVRACWTRILQNKPNLWVEALRKLITKNAIKKQTSQGEVNLISDQIAIH